MQFSRLTMFTKLPVICTIYAIFNVLEARPVDDGNSRILRFYNVNNGLGNYTYAYQTSNGIYREETGTYQDSSNTITGVYSYTVGDQRYEVHYVADDAGYRPTIIQYTVQPATDVGYGTNTEILPRGGREFSLNSLGLHAYQDQTADLPKIVIPLIPHHLSEDTTRTVMTNEDDLGKVPYTSEVISPSTTEETRKEATSTINSPTKTDTPDADSTSSTAVRIDSTTTASSDIDETKTTIISRETTQSLSTMESNPLNSEDPNLTAIVTEGDATNMVTTEITTHSEDYTSNEIPNDSTSIQNNEPVTESGSLATTASTQTVDTAESETASSMNESSITEETTGTANTEVEEPQEPITPLISIDVAALRSLAGGGLGK